MMFRDVTVLCVLLADWGLIGVVNPDTVMDIAPLNQIKVLAYKDKADWVLEQKYNIGKKGKTQEKRINNTAIFRAVASKVGTYKEVRFRCISFLLPCYKYEWMPSGSTQSNLALKGEVQMGNLQKFHANDLPKLLEKINRNSIGMDEYLSRVFDLHETTASILHTT